MLGISSRSSCTKWFKQVEIFTAYDARRILSQIKNNPTLSGTNLAAKIKKIFYIRKLILGQFGKDLGKMMYMGC
jgi:hypothetical protein